MLRREQEGPDTPLPSSSEAMGPTVPPLALGVVLLTMSDSQVQHKWVQWTSHRAGRGGKVVCFLNSFLPLPDREILVAIPNVVKSSGLHIRFGDQHRSNFIAAPFAENMTWGKAGLWLTKGLSSEPYAPSQL